MHEQPNSLGAEWGGRQGRENGRSGAGRKGQREKLLEEFWFSGTTDFIPAELCPLCIDVYPHTDPNIRIHGSFINIPGTVQSMIKLLF